VKLWIDECLSPTLVGRANRRGYWATCNRDRDLLGASDKALHKRVIDEEAVFVTNDEADFVALYRRVDLHTGLLILPQTNRREAVWPLLDAALDYIERAAKPDRLVLG
jgi:predicted nuclease of predicted toxin-antitoxin system